MGRFSAKSRNELSTPITRCTIMMSPVPTVATPKSAQIRAQNRPFFRFSAKMTKSKSTMAPVLSYAHFKNTIFALFRRGGPFCEKAFQNNHADLLCVSDKSSNNVSIKIPLSFGMRVQKTPFFAFFRRRNSQKQLVPQGRHAQKVA